MTPPVTWPGRSPFCRSNRIAHIIRSGSMCKYPATSSSYPGAEQQTESAMVQLSSSSAFRVESTVREMVRSYISLPVTMICDGQETSGEVLNLTGFGALVHCTILPAVGATVRLLRGNRQATGEVIWSDEERFGLRFAGAISVRDWLSPDAGGTAWKDSKPDAASRVMQDLLLVSRLIDDLGHDLADDPDTAERHFSKIQNLDVAVQMLAVVCWQLGDHSVEGRDDMASATNLRRSCEAALQATS